jgi:hypothetical protein
VAVIEHAGVHFCPDVYIDGYLNVSALLSKLLSKKGNRDTSDQVFIVLGLGHFALMASRVLAMPIVVFLLAVSSYSWEE